MMLTTLVFSSFPHKVFYPIKQTRALHVGANARLWGKKIEDKKSKLKKGHNSEKNAF